MALDLPSHYGEFDDRRQSLLSIQAHPVTEVYCTGEGLIAMRRLNADPILFDSSDPTNSRRAALRRVKSLLDSLHRQYADESFVEVAKKMPVSESGGVGLTYNQLKEQVFNACIQSREIEKLQMQRAEAKAKKYKLKR